MSNKNSRFVEWEGKFNDSSVKIKTILPTPAIARNSERYVAATFKEAIDSGALLKLQIENELKGRGINTNSDEEDSEVTKLQKEIKEKEVVLLRGRDGSRKLTKQDGRTLALEIRGLRQRIMMVGSTTTELYQRTAEKLSEDERYRYYVHACTQDAATGRPFFKSFDEFKDNIDDEFVLEATNNFYKNFVGSDFLDKTVEIKWLIKYKFMNEKLQLIDDQGRLVDSDGRLVSDKGRLIDDKGNFVDIFGNKVDEDGNIMVETETDAYSV